MIVPDYWVHNAKTRSHHCSTLQLEAECSQRRQSLTKTILTLFSPEFASGGLVFKVISWCTSWRGRFKDSHSPKEEYWRCMTCTLDSTWFFDFFVIFAASFAPPPPRARDTIICLFSCFPTPIHSPCSVFLKGFEIRKQSSPFLTPIFATSRWLPQYQHYQVVQK